jgi:hypothetical protein
MTSDVRRPQKVSGSVLLLPVVLLVALFTVAVFVARIAPGRVTTGVYQVVVWEGTDHVEVPTEALSCERTGDTATCTAPVGARRLAIELGYTGAVEPGGCTARYGDRPVSCNRQMGFYGHASHTVWIPGGLGLTPEQRADLRAGVPWWRVESELTTAAAVLIVALGVATGTTTFVLRRRARPAPPRLRPVLTAGTAALGFGLFALTGHVLDPVLDGVSALSLSPISALAVAALAAWQWELSGPPLGDRTVSAVVAGGATIFCSGVALLVFGLQSGFID